MACSCNRSPPEFDLSVGNFRFQNFSGLSEDGMFELFILACDQGDIAERFVLLEENIFIYTLVSKSSDGTYTVRFRRESMMGESYTYGTGGDDLVVSFVRKEDRWEFVGAAEPVRLPDLEGLTIKDKRGKE